jgi:predicted ATPase
MLVGRHVERARIDALLARARGGHGGALVVRGEPGIGKSALLAYAEAQSTELRVMRARGVEAEADLPFSGLVELLRPLRALLDELPKGRRRRCAARWRSGRGWRGRSSSGSRR